jgi:phenylpropionate dioxygenase-like ring-hydroxylating dioxygenase large terminal subunit
MTATETHEPAAVGIRDFRPGAFALRDAWFPVIHTAAIKRKSVLRTVHGAPIHFWRDGGRVRATEDSPLDIERGRRREGELTGGTGDYPTVERYGYTWVWYGNPDAASLDLVPNVPNSHMPLEGMTPHYQGQVVFDCSYELVCENLLDLTHADFLHSELTGDPLGEDDEVLVESTSETVTMTRIAHGRPIPKLQRMEARGAARQDVCLVTLVYLRSGLCVLHGNFNPGMSIRMFHPNIPEFPDRCRTVVTYNPQHMSPLGKRLFPFTSHTVGRQDNWALRVQNPNYLHDDVQKDLSSRFDRADVRYRRVYQELVVRQQQGDFSYLPDGDPRRDITPELALDR